MVLSSCLGCSIFRMRQDITESGVLGGIVKLLRSPDLR